MRRTLKLLVLLGIGLLMARNKGPDGPDGNGNDIDPVTGRPRSSEERNERLNFQGKNASTDMAGVHDTADQSTKDGRATGQSTSTPSTSGEGTGSIDPRDIHGSFRDAHRDVDVDRVWSEGEMYFQDDGQIVKILPNGDGTYQVVVKDPSNPSGAPTTVMEALTESQFQRRLESERWFE